MTLPITTVLPLHSEKIKQGGQPLDSYLRELIFSLQRQYEDIAQAINGDIRTEVSQGSGRYLPTIVGTTGDGTATYARQIGYVVRQGLMVDVWFDLDWTLHTGTGDLTVTLPYLVALGDGNPFIGAVNTQTIAFSGYVVGMGQSNSRQMLLIDSASGVASVNISMLAAASLRGHLRYVGQEIERS